MNITAVTVHMHRLLLGSWTRVSLYTSFWAESPNAASTQLFKIAPVKARRQYPWKTGLFIVATVLITYFGFIAKRAPTETPSSKKMSDPQSFVDGLVKSEKVVIFSKSYCPFCKKAKSALQQVLGNNFTVVELDERQDGDAIQDYLNKLTGGRSVPRVFVGGKFIGGGDDTVAKQQSGELKQILQQAGAL